MGNRWNRLTPEDTQRGQVVAARACRPSFVMGLLLLTMTVCALHILNQFDLLRPDVLILLIGSWTTIAASETDVNSPLNQTLMDKIRGNLDYLYQLSTTLIYVDGTDTNDASNPRVITIDSSIDWRDRYVNLGGFIAAGTNPSVVVPGGTYDEYINSNLVHGDLAELNGVVQISDQFLYTESGDTDGTSRPRLDLGTDNQITGCFIFADSSDGSLKMRFSSGLGVGARDVAWNLSIKYSTDQGHFP